MRGAVGDKVDVLCRVRDKEERMVLTGKVPRAGWAGPDHHPAPQTRKCLNLGSYNYLGFAGQDPWCTPAAREAVRRPRLLSLASRVWLGV